MFCVSWFGFSAPCVVARFKSLVPGVLEGEAAAAAADSRRSLRKTTAASLGLGARAHHHGSLRGDQLFDKIANM